MSTNPLPYPAPAIGEVGGLPRAQNEEQLPEVVANPEPGELTLLGEPEEVESWLSQATIYLANAPKSDAVTRAYSAAAQDAAATARESVPLHLRNAVTPLMKSFGYGKDYRYVHDDPQARDALPARVLARSSLFRERRG